MTEGSGVNDASAVDVPASQGEIWERVGFQHIIGRSNALRRALEMVETAAPNNCTILVLGETGCGKELIARAIHDQSQRRGRQFVKLNCAAIPTGLLESELFGHEKGAFTGAIMQRVGRLEAADQGTLFLDEVGDIPLDVQPKLLRALQEQEFERLGSSRTRKVNVRLIAATNRHLEKMVANREFRSDLYYRLNVFPIRVPSLRERREDIPILVSYFTQRFAKELKKNISHIPKAVMQGLIAWDWPGNIRELEHFIERSVLLTRGTSLQAPLGELREFCESDDQPSPFSQSKDEIARIVKETLSAVNSKSNDGNKRDEIVRALTECRGQVGGQDGAASRMGLNRTTLISRMKKLGIDPQLYA
jgi:formate hydrogenlyase transcriptional activator